MIPLAAFEEIIDASGIAPRIEAMLPDRRARPAAERPHPAAGHAACPADHRPAHLTRVHQALISLPRGRPAAARRDHGLEARPAPAHLPADRAHLRPGRRRPSARTSPTGCPPARCSAACDDLLEASVPEEFKDASRLAGRGLDGPGILLPAPAARHQRLRRPRSVLGPPQEQPAAQRRRAVLRLLPLRRGHDARRERAAPSPRLARRATVSSCRNDPVRAFAPVLTAMPAAGIPLGDILDDSGYAHRDAGAWAIPLRAAGAPARPGPAPARPRAQGHPRRRGHQQRQPVLPPDTAPAAGARAARPHRHQGTGRGLGTQDRRAGPVQARPPHQRRPRRLPPRAVPRRHGQDPLPAPPRVDDAGPGPARKSCSPRNIPRPAAHSRRSPSRRTCSPRPRRNTTTRPRPGAAPTAGRTGAERGFATAKDPATNDISRGWCRLMGLAPLMLFTTTLLIARNQRILHAWNTRQEETQRRAAAGLPPKTRKRRRKTLAGLAAGPP